MESNETSSSNTTTPRTGKLARIDASFFTNNEPSFPYTRLPRELQQKILQMFYEDPFEIEFITRLDQIPGSQRSTCDFKVKISTGPLWVSHAFRDDAFAGVIKTRNKIAVLTDSYTSESHMLGCNNYGVLSRTHHAIGIAQAVAIVKAQNLSPRNLHALKNTFPNLNAIEAAFFCSTYPSNSQLTPTARQVIDRAPSLMQVLRGDLDDTFCEAVRFDIASKVEAGELPKLDDVSLTWSARFHHMTRWRARGAKSDGEQYRLPGELFVFKVHLTRDSCTIIKKHFSKTVKYSHGIPGQYTLQRTNEPAADEGKLPLPPIDGVDLEYVEKIIQPRYAMQHNKTRVRWHWSKMNGFENCQSQVELCPE